jgi:VanZ family protein
MFEYTSPQEKRIWLLALLVVVIIFATLFVGSPLAGLVQDQNVAAAFFLLGMLIVGAAILLHAFQSKPGKLELAIGSGILAVFIMFFLRLGLAERSHVIEYCVLAILLHKALLERVKGGKHIPVPAASALVMTFLIGVIDECIQIVIPDRHFDPTDIVFNGLAAVMGVVPYLIINWVRKLRGKKLQEEK